MKILVSGGGTGGHITPALAVIEALESKVDDLEILYIGSKQGMENSIVPKIGICFEGISAGKFRRYHQNIFLDIFNPFTIFKNLADFFKIFIGIYESILKIKKFQPNTIFLKGGYVSLPVGIAAKILRVPFVLHESDSIPGISNRLLSKYAATVCVSFPEEYFEGIFSKKPIYTGNPIRKEIIEGDKGRAQTKFSLKKELPIIMVMGGSQGANKINRLIDSALEDILYKYQLIHITGTRDYDWIDFRANKLAKELKENYKYFDFISSDLKDAYAVSDLVISRAGCNVLTELAATKKPCILIPILSSAGNHQYENALIFSRKGAAYLMDEGVIEGSDLLRQINFMVENKEERNRMSKAISLFYKEDAASKIADEVLKIRLKEKKKDDKERTKV